MKLGFIGIGQMGRHMSRRLVEAGHTVTIYDVNRAAAEEVLARGAVWADSPKAVAGASDIVISSLPKPQNVSDMVFGENGLSQGWKRGDIYIDMSTNSPTTVREVHAAGAKAGVGVLDAPVSGGTAGAESGSLTIMVGGDEATLAKARPVLEVLGPKIIRTGDIGCGNIAKLVNNLISLACTSITSEGFVLGVKAGIDPTVMLDILSASTGDNWPARQYPASTFKGNFEPGFRLSLAYKDINLALGLGEEYHVPLPVGSKVRESLEAAINAGYADKSVDAIILPYEEATGTVVRVARQK
jgi:3-hydroxyisobutyrate dehydrogenase-like beta-hydroxyacid dehydrogenase